MNPPVTRADLVEESGFKRHGVVSSSVKVVSWKGGTKTLCGRIETSPCSFSMGLKALAAGASLSSATSREQDKVGGYGESQRCLGGFNGPLWWRTTGWRWCAEIRRVHGIRTLITRKSISLILLGMEQLVGAAWKESEFI